MRGEGGSPRTAAFPKPHRAGDRLAGGPLGAGDPVVVGKFGPTDKFVIVTVYTD